MKQHLENLKQTQFLKEKLDKKRFYIQVVLA